MRINKEMFKKKVFIIPAVLVLSTLLVVAGVYLFVGSASVDVTVSEALSVTSVPIAFDSIFPGETLTETITIENKASVPLNVELSYTEKSNEFVLDNSLGTCLPYPSETCEKRIIFEQTMALNDLNTISWEANVVEGYMPHVDVFLDNGETLVFEYAKVDITNCDSGSYPVGVMNTFGDNGIVDSEAMAWLSSGPAGPCTETTSTGDLFPFDGFIFEDTYKSLADWKIAYPTANITKIEVEIDNWISPSNSNVWNVGLNGNIIGSGVDYTKPSVILETIPASLDEGVTPGTIDIGVDFIISGVSPVGEFTGVVNVERVA